MVVNTLYTWQSDPLFQAAEEVQDSADRLQSSFHQWQLLLQRRECGDEALALQRKYADAVDNGDSVWPKRSEVEEEDVVVVTVDQQVDEEGVRLVMLCACDTLRWQLEAFERAARDDEWRAAALGEAPSRVDETRERRRQFVSAIHTQLQQVQAVIRPAIGAASSAASPAGSTGAAASSFGSSSSGVNGVSNAISGVDSGGIRVAFPTGLAAAAAAATAADAGEAASNTESEADLVSPARPSPFRVAGIRSDSALDSRFLAFLTPPRVPTSRSSSGESASSFVTSASGSSSSTGTSGCSTSTSSGSGSPGTISSSGGSPSGNRTNDCKSANRSSNYRSKALHSPAPAPAALALHSQAPAPAALALSPSFPVTTGAKTALATAAGAEATTTAAAAAAAAGAAAGAAAAAILSSASAVSSAALASSASAVSSVGRWLAGSPTRGVDGGGGADVAADDWLRVRRQAVRASMSDEDEEVDPLSVLHFDLRAGSQSSPPGRETSSADRTKCDDSGGRQLGREQSDSEHAPLFGGGSNGGDGDCRGFGGGGGEYTGFGPETGGKGSRRRSGRKSWWQRQQGRQQQPSWKCLVYWLRQIQRPGEGGEGACNAYGSGYEKERVGSARLLLDGRVDIGEMELGLLQLNKSQVAQMNAHWPAQRLAEEDEEDSDQTHINGRDDAGSENQRLVFGWQLSVNRKKRRSRSNGGGGKGGECDGVESKGGAVVLMGMNCRQVVSSLVAVVACVLLVLLIWSWSGAGVVQQGVGGVSSLPPPND